MSVRVRYAPSPTGLQHIGGIRTALFNYFFARSRGGAFILRIEDTDWERYHEEALQDLYDTFAWLGIDWDEGPGKDGGKGPYVQSERFPLYQEHAGELMTKGAAYRCFCSARRLEVLREEQQINKQPIGYDRHCRNLSKGDEEKNLEAGLPFVVRFKIPLEGETSLNDQLLGEVVRKNTDISPDPVLIKSDGYPTYHMANVVDDHLMEITHILRAQEWIPSGPLHVLLYQAFGWVPPVYCHLPMVMGSDGQKLSKRHGATSLREFIKAGYLPEAVLNYISLLGWSYDDKAEFFSRGELEKVFSLEKLNKAPAVFDYKKLGWFNGQYIRMKNDEELADKLIPFLGAAEVISAPPGEEQKTLVLRSIPLIRERLQLLGDAAEMMRFLFHEPDSFPASDLIPKKMDSKKTLEILGAVKTVLADYESRNEEENETAFKRAAEELGVNLGAVLMPVRVAITGSKVSPPLFGSIDLIGVPKVLERLDRAIEMLKSEV